MSTQSLVQALSLCKQKSFSFKISHTRSANSSELSDLYLGAVFCLSVQDFSQHLYQLPWICSINSTSWLSQLATFNYDKLDEHSTHVRVSIILIVFKFACYINIRIVTFEVSAKDQYLSGMINSITFFCNDNYKFCFSTIIFFLEINLMIDDRGVKVSLGLFPISKRFISLWDSFRNDYEEMWQMFREAVGKSSVISKIVPSFHWRSHTSANKCWLLWYFCLVLLFKIQDIKWILRKDPFMTLTLFFVYLNLSAC